MFNHNIITYLIADYAVFNPNCQSKHDIPGECPGLHE